MRIEGNRQAPQLQPATNAAATTKTAQAPDAAQTTPQLRPAGGDQFAAAKNAAPEYTRGASLAAPDTLRRASAPRNSGDEVVTLPEDKITGSRKPDRVYADMSKSELDAAAKKIDDLVAKGDPASLKAAVDRLFTLGEAGGPKNLEQVLRRLRDSRGLIELIKKSGPDNRARLENAVNHFGNDEAKSIHKKAQTQAIDENILGRELPPHK
jgi:hypothetical protein